MSDYDIKDSEPNIEKVEKLHKHKKKKRKNRLQNDDVIQNVVKASREPENDISIETNKISTYGDGRTEVKRQLSNSESPEANCIDNISLSNENKLIDKSEEIQFLSPDFKLKSSNDKSKRKRSKKTNSNRSAESMLNDVSNPDEDGDGDTTLNDLIDRMESIRQNPSLELTKSFSMTDMLSSRSYEPMKKTRHQIQFSKTLCSSTSQDEMVEENRLRSENEKELLKFFPDRKAKIMVITWNLAETTNYPESFKDLIYASESEVLFDLYLFCFQETAINNRNELLDRLQYTFGSHFVVYDSAVNGEIFSVLIGHREFIWNIGDIRKATLSTRVTTKTKGTASMSFKLFGTSFLFIGSHLSSDNYHRQTGDKGRNSLRIEDYNAIISSKDLIRNLIDSASKNGEDDKLWQYFDNTIWAGDLNFRLELDDITVRRLIKSELELKDCVAIEKLLEVDELVNGQVEGIIFQDFQEGRITFLPSYRFDKSGKEYTEQRTPSYTDRILFQTSKDCGMECLYYGAVDAYECSDHRPVYAVFEVEIEPQTKEFLPKSGSFNKDVYYKNYEKCELTNNYQTTNAVTSRTCTIQ